MLVYGNKDIITLKVQQQQNNHGSKCSITIEKPKLSKFIPGTVHTFRKISL